MSYKRESNCFKRMETFSNLHTSEAISEDQNIPNQSFKKNFSFDVDSDQDDLYSDRNLKKYFKSSKSVDVFKNPLQKKFKTKFYSKKIKDTIKIINVDQNVNVVKIKRNGQIFEFDLNNEQYLMNKNNIQNNSQFKQFSDLKNSKKIYTDKTMLPKNITSSILNKSNQKNNLLDISSCRSSFNQKFKEQNKMYKKKDIHNENSFDIAIDIDINDKNRPPKLKKINYRDILKSVNSKVIQILEAKIDQKYNSIALEFLKEEIYDDLEEFIMSYQQQILILQHDHKLQIEKLKLNFDNQNMIQSNSSILDEKRKMIKYFKNSKKKIENFTELKTFIKKDVQKFIKMSYLYLSNQNSSEVSMKFTKDLYNLDKKIIFLNI